MTSRTCAWCRGPIPAASRRDAITCSTPCRQARHRYTTGVGAAVQTDASPGSPLRLAYADPPYPGNSRRYYGDHPDFAGEVDHVELISRLVATYDGWALSTSARALPEVLASCPPGVRVAAWFRGFRPNVVARGPVSGWEPVVFAGGRYASPGTGATQRVDVLTYRPGVRTTDPARVIGAKPAAFYGWVFRDLLGALPCDSFVDLFPGSGGGARAWETYRAADASRRPARQEATR